MRLFLVSCFALFAFFSAYADVLVSESFEEQGAWQGRGGGKHSIELVAGGEEGKCLKLVSGDLQSTAYYTLRLDPKLVRGKTITARGKVKVENVVQGEKVYCTAKFHFGGRVEGTAYNRAEWFTGTKDWFDAKLVAEMPKDITDPVFDLAIQNASGAVYFDSLVICDDLEPMMALDMKEMFNTNLSDGVAGDGRGGFIDTGNLNLRDLPRGKVALGDWQFRVLIPGANVGATCLALRGAERPSLPLVPGVAPKKGKKAAKLPVIPVGQKGRSLLFLQAAAFLDPSRTGPCLEYTVRYQGGDSLSIPIHEGRDIGAFDAPADLPNWRVVWKQERFGKTVGVGVTRWQNPKPDIVIESIQARSPGTGAVPIVLAVTLDRRE